MAKGSMSGKGNAKKGMGALTPQMEPKGAPPIVTERSAGSGKKVR